MPMPSVCVPIRLMLVFKRRSEKVVMGWIVVVIGWIVVVMGWIVVVMGWIVVVIG